MNRAGPRPSPRARIVLSEGGEFLDLDGQVLRWWCPRTRYPVGAVARLRVRARDVALADGDAGPCRELPMRWVRGVFRWPKLLPLAAALDGEARIAADDEPFPGEVVAGDFGEVPLVEQGSGDESREVIRRDSRGDRTVFGSLVLPSKQRLRARITRDAVADLGLLDAGLGRKREFVFALLKFRACPSTMREWRPSPEGYGGSPCGGRGRREPFEDAAFRRRGRGATSREESSGWARAT